MKSQPSLNRFSVIPMPMITSNAAGFRRTPAPARPPVRAALITALLGITLGLSSELSAANQTAAGQAMGRAMIASARPAGPVDGLLATSDMDVTYGKSALLRLPAPVTRISIGNPDVADVTLISPGEIYVLGKSIGTTNVILWTRGGQTGSGQTAVINVTVILDAAALQAKLRELMPGETDIKVTAAGDSLVLSGTVSDTLKADRAVALADAYVRAAAGGQGGQRGGKQGGDASGGGQGGGGQGGGDEPKGAGQGLGSVQVVNLLQVGSNQQVMLEVKVAEINRKVAERLGFDFQRAARKAGSAWTQIMTGIIGGAPGMLFQSRGTPDIGDAFLIDAEKKDELFHILAEPNIVAISGQEASFLVGGEVMIPIPQFAGVITLQSRQFGVGLRFTPTVLEEGRINLVVSPEVTELVKFDTVATTGLGGVLAVPTFTTRRVSTTVQLRDGQSLAIGGLLQDNIKETIKRFPVLGEIPILGALFRSSDFQKDKTELMVVVTPRLIKPLQPDYALPTDAFVQPDRPDFLFDGRMEGSPTGLLPKGMPASEYPPQYPPSGQLPGQPQSQPQPQPRRDAGFEMK
ncbi:type II and III secretion system protein family protein [Nitrosospira multiformis]|uniref:type II and III secretion system protein family protein n=1 Tax=Nitrosospira multiformis TaxID=1231 RepID=UPI0008951EF6|nr:type II and III secretion system protein family protein [Nitrosospira multiformis]SEA44571.1 pilus assembly protein CpaC [Nitrosospira multiformis]